VGNVQQSWVIGSPGVDPGEFRQPWGITVRDGRIYVADSRGGRVQVLSTTDGAFLFDWTTKNTSGRPWAPSGVALGTNGLVYVVDAFALYAFAVNVD
jgi:outer membrane protein assembly factor BamB